MSDQQVTSLNQRYAAQVKQVLVALQAPQSISSTGLVHFVDAAGLCDLSQQNKIRISQDCMHKPACSTSLQVVYMHKTYMPQELYTAKQARASMKRQHGSAFSAPAAGTGADANSARLC